MTLVLACGVSTEDIDIEATIEARIASIPTPTPQIVIQEVEVIVEKEIEYIPALFNIYNEILVNAKEQVTTLIGLYMKDKNVNLVTEIKVCFSPETGEISIMNNGDGIDIIEHPKEKKNGKPIYIPQLIFGELLTSTNYNKDEKKVVKNTIKIK